MSANQLRGYIDLVEDIGMEEQHYQTDVQRGKTPFPRQDYSKMMHIQKDQEQIIRAVAVEAFNQLLEMDKRWDERLAESRKAHRLGTPESNAEMDALREQWGKEYRGIFEAAAAKLKLQLGDKAFNTVDEWIDQNEDRSRILGGNKASQQRANPSSK